MTIPWLSPADGGICRLGAGNGVVSNAAQRAAGIGGNRRAVVPIANAVAIVGNRGSDRKKVSDKGDNHNSNHIEEVIHSNNEHPGFPVITGRLEQPANRW